MKSSHVFFTRIQICPFKCNTEYIQILTLQFWHYKHNCKHMHTEASNKAVSLALGLMAAGLTGTRPGWQVVMGSAEARASLHVSGFVSLAPLQKKALKSLTTTETGGGGANCHWGACLLWLIINYCAAGSKASVSAATSSVKHTHAPASCRDAGRAALLTTLWFGCPLVELELGEQGAILVVLLHIQAHGINHFIITG